MRLKEIFWMLGFKPRIKKYGIHVEKLQLEEDGEISVAQWMHPRLTAYRPTQKEVNALRGFIKPGDTCIDIGAHTGDTSLPMGLAAEKAGTVFALEPNSYVYETLQTNANLNPDKYTIIPLPFAATTTDAEMTFEYSDSGFCNGGLHENISVWRHGHMYKLKVTGKNLSDYLNKNYPEKLPRLKFIKIDAEGYDLSILKSIDSMISKYLPYLRVEVYKKTDNGYRSEMFEYLKNKGYRVFLFNSPESYYGKELTVNELMDKKHFDIFATPPGAGQ